MSVLFKLGDSGLAVGAMHQALLEAGLVIPQSELDSRTFGPGTEAAVSDFQRHNVDLGGRALGVDGVVGPKTWYALKGGTSSLYTAPGWSWNKAADPRVLAVVVDAVADIGKREAPDGSNDGPDLAKFAPRGRPWCALAVSAWYARAAGGSPFGTMAAVVGLVAWGRSNGALVPEGDPVRAGDIVCWLRAGGRGHTGLIVGTTDTGDLCTVEGNSQNAVRALVRPRTGVAAIIRPIP